MTNKCCEILYHGLKPARREAPKLTEMMCIPPVLRTESRVPIADAPFPEPLRGCVRVAIMSQLDLEKFQADQPSCSDLLKDQPSVSELVAHQPGLAELIENQPTPADLYHDIELQED